MDRWTICYEFKTIYPHGMQSCFEELRDRVGRIVDAAKIDGFDCEWQRESKRKKSSVREITCWALIKGIDGVDKAEWVRREVSNIIKYHPDAWEISVWRVRSDEDFETGERIDERVLKKLNKIVPYSW